MEHSPVENYLSEQQNSEQQEENWPITMKLGS